MGLIKGGWRMNRVIYSEFARKVFDEAIAHRRPTLIIPADHTRGTRFNSNDAILIRLESNYTEDAFMRCPGMAVDAMLIDAAHSDWWYDNEKCYDEHYFIDESENDCDIDDGE